MNNKLFNKIFIIIISLVILCTDNILAQTKKVDIEEYLLNNFTINFDYNQYSLDKSKELEDKVDSLIGETVSNIMNYSEIKSVEVETNLVEYGNFIQETIVNEIYRSVDNACGVNP